MIHYGYRMWFENGTRYAEKERVGLEPPEEAVDYRLTKVIVKR